MTDDEDSGNNDSGGYDDDDEANQSDIINTRGSNYQEITSSPDVFFQQFEHLIRDMRTHNLHDDILVQEYVNFFHWFEVSAMKKKKIL